MFILFFRFFFFKELYKPKLVRRPPEAFTKQVFAQAMAAMPRRREIRGFPTTVRRHLFQLEACLGRAVKAYPETKEAFRVLQQKVHVETDGMSAQIQKYDQPPKIPLELPWSPLELPTYRVEPPASNLEVF